MGHQLRPDWKKLFKKGASAGLDYSVSPIHEIADDIPDEPPPGTGGTAGEMLVTGLTTEHPTSEIIFNDSGDILYHRES